MPAPIIIIFVKAPRPGFVKTRLAAAIGNVDDDPDLDIWTIDDAGQPFHVSSDIDTGQRFGL